MSQLKRAQAPHRRRSPLKLSAARGNHGARGYRLEGERFIEHDSFGTREARLNPNDAQAQMSEGDEALIRHTFGNGMPSPHWEQADASRALGWKPSVFASDSI